MKSDDIYCIILYKDNSSSQNVNSQYAEKKIKQVIYIQGMVSCCQLVRYKFTDYVISDYYIF